MHAQIVDRHGTAVQRDQPLDELIVSFRDWRAKITDGSLKTCIVTVDIVVAVSAVGIVVVIAHRAVFNGARSVPCILSGPICVQFPLTFSQRSLEHRIV